MSEPGMPLSTIVVVATNVLTSEIGSEHVVLNLRDGTYYGLEDVGGEIWKLLQNPVSLEEICRAIVEIYEVDVDCCRRDVVKLVGELVARGLVEVRVPAPRP